MAKFKLAPKTATILTALVFGIVTGQDFNSIENKKTDLCELCVCYEIRGDNSGDVLEILCSGFQHTEELGDLDKIRWPTNQPNSVIRARFERMKLSTLGKLPPNQRVVALSFENNALKMYWPEPFADIVNLSKVSFAHNLLTDITPDLFKGAHRLTDLDLSYNKLTKFGALDFELLENLKRLNLRGNQLKIVPVNALRTITFLEYLDLGENGIFDLLFQKAGVFESLRALNMSGNSIRSILKDSFPINNSIETIDLSYNMIEIIEEEAFSSCPKLKNLNLAHNNLSNSPTTPSSLIMISLKSNLLNQWPQFPKDIVEIDISDNQVGGGIVLQSFNSLKLLNLQKNYLKEVYINGKLPKLKDLDLSYNLLSAMPINISAKTLPSLEILKMDGNSLQNIAFKYPIRLKALYLRRLNLLTNLQENAFKNVAGKIVLKSNDENITDCISIHLSNCSSLSKIEENVFQDVKLCTLDLSNNNLTEIPDQLVNWSALESVDLQHNPWNCSCDFQWFLDDVMPHLYKQHSPKLSELRCGSPRSRSGVRLVHWYSRGKRALCQPEIILAKAYQESRWTLVNDNFLTYILAACIITGVVLIFVLMIYIVRGHRSHKLLMAAMRRKRQSTKDENGFNGISKEQFTKLNEA